MTTPMLEERGLVVPDGLFEIPDASPSGADFVIPSQFDNPRGQFRGTMTFGKAAREDTFSYLRSIGGGGSSGWTVAAAARWCGGGPGPERYELSSNGAFDPAPPVCAEFNAPMKYTTKGRTVERTVEDLTRRTWGGKTMGAVVACSVKKEATYARPRDLEASFGSQFGRAARFDKDPIDVRAVPGAYEEVVANFAQKSCTTALAGAAHASYTIGQDARKVDFVAGKDGPTSYIAIDGEGSFYYDVILAEKKRLQTRRPYMLCSVARDCCPDTVPAVKSKLVYQHPGLHRVLADPAALAAVKATSPADADGDDEHNLSGAWWPNAKPGTAWPPSKRRQPGKKTVVRQRQFGSAPRLELVDGMRNAGKLKCSDGPGPCAYDPVNPKRLPITAEAAASLNVTCGYRKAGAPEANPARRRTAAAASSEGAPRNLAAFPRPPDWLNYPSPAGAKILAMPSPSRVRPSTTNALRTTKARSSAPRLTAVDYDLNSPLQSRKSISRGHAETAARGRAREAAAESAPNSRASTPRSVGSIAEASAAVPTVG